MTNPVSMPFQAPLHPVETLRYTDSEMIQVVFTPTAACMERILPKPLKPGLLGGAYLAKFRNTPFGDEMYEAAIVVQCTYKEHYGVYTLVMYTDNDPSCASHREVWGYPAKMAEFKWERDDNEIEASIHRAGETIVDFEVEITGPGDWIDTGDSINLKLIPSVDGKGYDVKQITAAKLDVKIHEGLGGEGKLTFGSNPWDPLDKIMELENIVAGLYFKLDLTANLGRVIAEPEL
jgi:acetoacetate decarboxylase